MTRKAWAVALYLVTLGTHRFTHWSSPSRSTPSVTR